MIIIKILEMIDTICWMFSIFIYLRTIIFGVDYIRMPLTPKKIQSPIFRTPKNSPITKSLEEMEKLDFVQRIFKSPSSKKRRGMGGSKKRRGGQRSRRTRKVYTGEDLKWDTP
jgi:hypothetical protein